MCELSWCKPDLKNRTVPAIEKAVLEVALENPTVEEKAAEENPVLTQAQLQPIEKAKEQWAAQGEIESEHPEYMDAQDTYYVCTRKDRKVLNPPATDIDPPEPGIQWLDREPRVSTLPDH